MRAQNSRLIAVLLSAAAVAPAATIINFDSLPASSGGVVTPSGVTPFVGQTVPSNFSPLVTFSVPTGALFVYSEASQWAGNPPASTPNVVCPAQIALASSAMCTETLLVNFAQPVNALSFWAGAWDDIGSTLLIDVYTGNNIFTNQIQITSPQRMNTQGIINVSTLSQVANITGLRIFLPSPIGTPPGGDRNGLVFDNFAFDVPGPPVPPSNPIPEPSSALLLMAGAAGLCWRKFRG